MKYSQCIKSPLILSVVFLSGLLTSCSSMGIFEAAPKLGDSRQRQVDGMTMDFVPSGEFLMGVDYLGMRYAIKICKQYRAELGPGVCLGSSFADEMPSHPVMLDAFWIDHTEVTNEQYKSCVEDNACFPPAETGSYTRVSYFNDDAYADYPVVWVTRDQAVEYCAWVGGRLPTEAEWEYAARGPDNRNYPWGDDFEKSYVNYCDASCAAGPNDLSYDDGFPETAPVGSFPAGASWCGSLDMAGNVREWVSDWFGYYTADLEEDPSGPEDGETYLTKGGCWLDTPVNLRSSNRGQNTTDYIRHKVGFRCVMDLD